MLPDEHKKIHTKTIV